LSHLVQDDTARLHFADGLKRLSELGLVQIQTTGDILLHRLLARFVRETVAQNDDDRFAVEAAILEEPTRILHGDAPWTAVRFDEHLFSVHSEFLKRQGSISKGAYAELYTVILGLGGFDVAKKSAKDDLAKDERDFGFNHPQVAVSLNKLGLALYIGGELAEAREAFERALGIDKKVFGEIHPRVAVRANNLGRVVYKLGDLTEAKILFEGATTVFTQIRGKRHSSCAACYSNLGEVLYAMGDFVGAREAFECALEIDGQGEEEVSTEYSLTVFLLGTVLRSANDLAALSNLTGQVLKRTDSSGAEISIRLGDSLYRLGQLDEARIAYERGLRLRENYAAEQQIGLGGCFVKYARTLLALGRREECSAAYLVALENYEKGELPKGSGLQIAISGLQTPDSGSDFSFSKTRIEITPPLYVGPNLNELGGLFLAENQLDYAERAFRRAIEVFEFSDPPDRLGEMTAMLNLSRVLQAAMKLTQAKDAYTRAIAFFQKYELRDRMALGYVLYGLTKVLFELQDFAEARGTGREALAAFNEPSASEEIGKVVIDEPSRFMIVVELSAILNRVEDFEASKEACKHAMALYEEMSDRATYGSSLAGALNALGDIQFRLGEFREAKVSYQEALAAFGGDKCPHGETLAVIYQSLAMTYEKLEDPSEAAAAFDNCIIILEQIDWIDVTACARKVIDLGFMLFRHDEGRRAVRAFECCLTKIVDSDSSFESGAAFMGLGMALLSCGEAGSAKSAFERSLSILGPIEGTHGELAGLAAAYLTSLGGSKGPQ
jgi:tetratricopeptide (TPR) repeat protein